jgi:Flp pilus assembly protein TadG
MSFLATLRSPLRRLSKDKRGNVLMLMGFALIPITMAAGMTVDYGRAARLKTKLDAAADAAALSAVADAAGAATDKTVCERAGAMFDSQASAITGITYNRATSIVLTVGSAAQRANVTYNGATGLCSAPLGVASNASARVVSLTYTVASNNVFGGLFNKPTIAVSGKAESEISLAPDVDFYVALDTSPSMALPVTTAGIAQMVAATSTAGTPNGCTFACHSNKIQVNTSGSLGDTPQDIVRYGIVKEAANRQGFFSGSAVTYVDADNAFLYNASTGRKVCYDRGSRYGSTSSTGCADYRADKHVYNADGTLTDTYWYAQNKSIVLRIDELRRATADLVTTALAEAARNEATYRAAIYAFDYEENFRQVQSLVKIAEKNPTSGTLANGVAFRAKANSSAVELAMLDDKTANGCPATNCRTGSNNNTYLFTSFKGLLDGMSATGTLPATGGNGTRTGSDTPQTWIFIVTDGMSDEKTSVVGGLYSLGNDRTRSEITGTMPTPGSTTHLAKCNALKARNIKIAILYTEYTAASIQSDEANQRGWVQGRIPFVENALRNCASGSDYFAIVREGSDISDELSKLFRKAVAKPRLVR